MTTTTSYCYRTRFLLLFIILLTIIIKSSFSFPYHEVYQHLNFDDDKCPQCEECPETSTTSLEIFLYFCSTLEVLLRSFAMGFGLKLGHTLLTKTAAAATTSEAKADSPIDRKSLKTCIWAGIAVMCIAFGTSLFIPTNLRTKWF